MALNNFPYADQNITNLDFLLSTYKQIKSLIDGGIKDLVAEQIGDLFLDTVYDPETETVTFTLSLKEM